MKLEQLIEVAKKGAVLSHPHIANGITIRNEHFEYADGTVLPFLTCTLNDRWQIETPHPGACTECKGLGDIAGGWCTCPRCKGTGLEATPDPSADCLPDIQEVKYLIGSIKQALQAFPGDSMFTETSVGLRYGTIRDFLAIMLNDAEEMGRSWEAKKETK